MKRWRIGLAVILLSAAGLLGCARERTGASVVRSSALAALPQESVGLLVVEVNSLGRTKAVSSWMKEMAAAAERGGPLTEIRDRFGLEAVKKLNRMGLVVVPMADDRLGWALLMEGEFDPEALRRGLGGEEIAMLEGMEGAPELGVTMIEGGHLALGSRAALETIRENAAAGGRGLDRNEALLGMLEGVRATSQIWGAIDCRAMTDLARKTGVGLLDRSPIPDTPLSSTLHSLAFQGRFGRDLEFDLFGETDDAESARLLSETLRGIVAFGRLGAGEASSSEWAQFLERVRIDQEGTSITLTGSIPEETLVALAEKTGGAAPPADAAPPR